MTGERARGAVLYGCALAMLAAGATWWAGAAPQDPAEVPAPEQSDQAIQQWKRSVQQLLPAEPGQLDGGTVLLAAGVEQDVQAELETGSYRVTMVCGGGVGSQVWIRFSETGDDSGVGMPCTGARDPFGLVVAVADRLRMKVSVDNSGPVVFGYAVVRN